MAGGSGSSAAVPRMERYRAYGAFYERYWSHLFGVTRADLDLLAEFIESEARASGRASDLTGLVRAVVIARLSQGPRLNSTPAPDAKVSNPLVRKWDPEASWAVGDRAIFVVPDLDRVRGFAPWLGEIVQVGSDHVLARIDGRSAPEVYALGPVARGRMGPSPDARMAGLAQSDDAGSCTDEVIWRFGTVVVGRLLGAMKVDSRFVELDGAWFVRDLSRQPRDQELAAAARALFGLQASSLTLDSLLSHVSSDAPVSVAERFGWALALEGRPDTFTRVSRLPQSRWALAGPPPVPLVARRTVYDPESFVILCTPGETLSASVARRLWDCGLLYAALGTSGALAVPADDQAATPVTEMESEAAPTRTAWWRRLPMSRH